MNDPILGVLQLLSGCGLAILTRRILREMPLGYLKLCLCGILLLCSIWSLEFALVNLGLISVPPMLLVVQRYLFAALGICCGLVSAGVLRNGE
jgi:hypothetical protein